MFQVSFIAVVSCLGVSLAANAFLFYLLFKRFKNRPLTRDAKALLSDVLRGGALVRIERVASEDVFIRSPRG